MTPQEQQTPLHIAARLGNADIVMMLLQHGAAVDSTTKDLYTALHIAAKEGQDEVSHVLNMAEQLCLYISNGYLADRMRQRIEELTVGAEREG